MSDVLKELIPRLWSWEPRARIYDNVRNYASRGVFIGGVRQKNFTNEFFMLQVQRASEEPVTRLFLDKKEFEAAALDAIKEFSSKQDKAEIEHQEKKRAEEQAWDEKFKGHVALFERQTDNGTLLVEASDPLVWESPRNLSVNGGRLPASQVEAVMNDAAQRLYVRMNSGVKDAEFRDDGLLVTRELMPQPHGADNHPKPVTLAVGLPRDAAAIIGERKRHMQRTGGNP